GLLHVEEINRVDYKAIRLRRAFMVCPQCQTINPDGAASCTECSVRFSRPSASAATMAMPGAQTAATQTIEIGSRHTSGLAAGTVIADRYEVLKPLGRGGMGAVYQTRDREFDRIVALKLIHPELA